MRFQGEAGGGVGAQLELCRVGPQCFGTVFTERQWAGNGRSGGEILPLHASNDWPTEQACRQETAREVLNCPVC